MVDVQVKWKRWNIHVRTLFESEEMLVLMNMGKFKIEMLGCRGVAEVEAVQEQYGPDGVAQQGMEIFQMTLEMIFDPLQGAYQGREMDERLQAGKGSRCMLGQVPITGVYEALELRDGGSEYLGKGVSKAVDNVNSIIGPALIGKDPTQQTEIDNFMVRELDGTTNEWGWCKPKCSLAVFKAGASVLDIPLYKHIANLAGNKNLVLPVPAFNVINGGSHAGKKLAMQEFMILPVGAKSFKEAMKMGVEVYHNLKSVIKKKYGQDATNVGDEGGFAPNIQENKEGLELLKTAVAKAGYTKEVVIGMDVAASKFYGSDKTFDLNFKEENNNGAANISGEKLKDMYKSFAAEYPRID
ncbi:hypothetical protein C5167_017200 [Papaver somniferum]|uniref:phosphopyruvate hydratase n=1 Tax=Papaver somniferum TaxID=3469 RepID=A0A4Y7IMU2_PAPSO|nr:hypothetical protein C5167_017200 [Papaver somniferum]